MIIKTPREFFKFIFDNKKVIDLHKIKNECEETGIQILPDLINDIEIIVNSEIVCNILAANGSFDAFKYAHEYYGCILNIWICHNAANNGQFEILKYAHEKGCPMNKYTSYYAARNGHLDCLKYAHINGCKWSIKITNIAAESSY